MPIFINSGESQFALVTSLKAMFSSFRKLFSENYDDVSLIWGREIDKGNVEFDFSKIPVIVVSRNPYNRCYSLYRDKCMMPGGRKEIKFLQYCQYDILVCLREIESLDFKIVPPSISFPEGTVEHAMLQENFKLLQGVNFSKFVGILERLHGASVVEEHFHEQVRIIRKVGIQKAEIFKVETIKENWSKLSMILGKEVPMPLDNRSGTKVDVIQKFAPEDFRVVNRIFADDFEFFGYEMLV